MSSSQTSSYCSFSAWWISRRHVDETSCSTLLHLGATTTCDVGLQQTSCETWQLYVWSGQLCDPWPGPEDDNDYDDLLYDCVEMAEQQPWKELPAAWSVQKPGEVKITELMQSDPEFIEVEANIKRASCNMSVKIVSVSETEFLAWLTTCRF